MSGDGVSAGSVEIGEPQKHVSAQVLQQMVPPRHTGFLRKRGKRERMIENLKFAKSLLSRLMRWRQRFVIVSHGCIYVFSSETASSPLSTLSLRGYNRLVKMESEQSPWTFRVIAPDANVKTYFFACHSDSDRKEWMKAIRLEMLAANNLVEDGMSGGSLSSDVYVYLQSPIFEPPVVRQVPAQDETSDTESQNSDYDKIDEEVLQKMRPSIPLPPTPEDNSYKAVVKGNKGSLETPKTKNEPPYINDIKKIKPPERKPQPKPTTKPKPTVSKTPSEAEYFFPGNNRDQALAALREKQQKGTYLVRKSRAGQNKVLAVMTEDDIKEYKILEKNKQVTINNREYYKSVEDLLMAYQKKPLPNRSTTLTRGFSTQDLTV